MLMVFVVVSAIEEPPVVGMGAIFEDLEAPGPVVGFHCVLDVG